MADATITVVARCVLLSCDDCVYHTCLQAEGSERLQPVLSFTVPTGLCHYCIREMLRGSCRLCSIMLYPHLFYPMAETNNVMLSVIGQIKSQSKILSDD